MCSEREGETGGDKERATQLGKQNGAYPTGFHAIDTCLDLIAYALFL